MRTNPHICLIEDDPVMGESLSERLTLEGYEVTWVTRGHAALETVLEQRFDVLISDIRLPDISGEELYRTLLARPRITIPPTLFITGYGTIEHAVRLLKLGAADYFTKPLDLGRLMSRLAELCGRPPGTDVDLSLGISPSMRELAARLPTLARHRGTPVLILGESGVGKEVTARALHDLSSHPGPFVAVNCAAIPESLVESVLFGHEKGAFTGADRRHHGVFEQAIGGTLFLDEIGDMPIDTQARLLRVIEDRSITRLGSEQPVAIDLHLVCATHHNLRTLVAAKRFREDLYYRVNVVPLQIPPLRERPEDILWLAERFLENHRESYPDEARTIDRGGRNRLLSHDWPGNARELKHVIERACILASGNTIGADDVGPNAPTPDGGDTLTLLGEHIEQEEQTHLRSALVTHEWRIQDTARMLGISRKSLWQKMKKYGIEKPA